MTGHQINSLVGDLVAMAQAMEELPKVRAELAEAYTQIDRRNNDNTSLQDDLKQSRAYVVSLQAKLHEAEVAKDAAETMFLEADERTSRALDFIKASFGSAGALIQSLEPVKSEPSVDACTTMIGASTEPGANLSAQGQSEPDPTVPASTSEIGNPATSLSATNSGSVSPQSMTEQWPNSAPSWASPTPAEPKPQPYAGLNYYDHPIYVPLDDWLAGGGTEDNYNWRPAPKSLTSF